MNQFKFYGRLTEIFDVQEGTSKNGDWKVIEFTVTEPSGDYPQSAKFRLFGADKVDNFLQYNKVGDDVEVSFNLKTNTYKKNTYNSLDAWKVFKQKADAKKQEDLAPVGNEDDDLPF